jgi:hypothetical protein
MYINIGPYLDWSGKTIGSNALYGVINQNINSVRGAYAQQFKTKFTSISNWIVLT